MASYKVCVVIPAFNEGANIRTTVKEVLNSKLNVTALVVNDGSKDDTEQQAHEEGAIVLTLPFNLGIGGAVQTGFKFANIQL